MQEAYDAGAHVDVEHASGLLSDPAFLADRTRVISSAHFPFGPPPDAAERLEAMGVLRRGRQARRGRRDLPPRLAIAALQAAGRLGAAADLSHGPRERARARPVGAPRARLSSIGPVEATTARGQLALSELLDVYDTAQPRASGSPLRDRRGGPVAESLSPRVHNALFRSRGLPLLYLPLPVHDFDRDRPHELDAFPTPRSEAFSVTRPWKLRPRRRASRRRTCALPAAANTLRAFSGRWRAENTDVDGIFDPLADHDTGEGRTAVILGAGGVARAAILAAQARI